MSSRLASDSSAISMKSFHRIRFTVLVVTTEATLTVTLLLLAGSERELETGRHTGQRDLKSAKGSLHWVHRNTSRLNCLAHNINCHCPFGMASFCPDDPARLSKSSYRIDGPGAHRQIYHRGCNRSYPANRVDLHSLQLLTRCTGCSASLHNSLVV